MFRWNRIPPQPSRILPSLPVEKSVLRQLGIADNELPHGLAHLKHNLLLSPSHTSSQESNICKNSGSLAVSGRQDRSEFWKRLYNTVAESGRQDLCEFWKRLYNTVAGSGPDRDKDKHASQMNIFKSMSYLDQIAIVCLSSGVHACQAPDCLEYRKKLEKIVPVCHSWPGLQDWVLCIISCSLRAKDMCNSSEPREDDFTRMSEFGLVSDSDDDPELFQRCWAHLTACILLTTTTIPEAGTTNGLGWELVEMTGSETRWGTGNASGSNDGPRPGQHIYSVEWMSEREPNSRRPPVPRPNIYMQTFDPLQEGSTAGPSVDVAEVFQLVAWFRNIARNDYYGMHNRSSPWHDDYFIPVVSKAVAEASEKLSKLGFCQQRVWEVVRNHKDGMIAVVPLVTALEYLHQLRHEGHESCTSGYCEHATQNFTSVTQLHKCPDPKYCITTTDKMFNQSLLVAALEDDTMTTAWSLDGMSLLAKGKSYLAVSHVWSDGTGTGAWKVGQVNICLWNFFVEIAKRLECSGVWWDTVCIPQDKAARSTALNNMHHNYAVAKCTLVHDSYLAGIEWESNGSPCIALALSPWFTRGWTALELLLSTRVIVLFRQGNGYTLKDLDQEIIARHRFLHSHAHWIATDAIFCLRDVSHTFYDGIDLLSVLQARYTSWSRDQSIIAGFMCGLTDHVTLSEKGITKRILKELSNINYDFLFHGLQTMSEPQFSWCPPRFVDIPSGTTSGGRASYLHILSNGILIGHWRIWSIPSKSYVDRRMIWPSSTDMYVQTQVQMALQEPEKCLILTCDTYHSQGLLVRPKAHKDHPEKGLYCKYIGVVNLCRCRIPKPGFGKNSEIFIGYQPEMIDVEVVDCELILEKYYSYVAKIVGSWDENRTSGSMRPGSGLSPRTL